MMRCGHRSEHDNESGVATMIEYVMVSGILMFLLVLMLLLVNANIMEGPANTLAFTAFSDIGNGVSTRIVDVYVIAPNNGTISTSFDIPHDVGGRGYFVQVGPGDNPVDQNVQVSRDTITSNVSLAGIGATRGVVGNTTGEGMNRIVYNSGGVS